jgi:dipeptidyl aminopeptidase/acylaminoacyl peptidase
LAILLTLSTPSIARGSDDAAVSYARDIVPFLDEHCIACHDEGFENSELSVDSLEAMLKGGRRGPAIVRGKSSDSLIIEFLTGKRQPQMPPKTSIPLDRIDVLRRWIDQGAKGDESTVVTARRDEARKQAADEAAAFASDAPPPVTSLVYSPDGKLLASAGYKEIVLVEPDTGKAVRRLAGFPDQVTSVSFSSDGRRIVGAGGAAGRHGEIRIWETEQWTEQSVLRGHEDTILAVTWRPNSSQVATASLDKLILIWDTDTGKTVRTIKSHADVISTLAYSSDGKRLASGSADKTAKIYDADSGLQTAGFSTHNDSVLSVAFSPDGQYLATGSADRGIALWKLDNLDNPQRGFGHTGPVYSLAWKPDSSSIWAGSGGRPSFLSYKKENGQRDANIDERTMPQDWVYAVAVAPDGQSASAGGWDGSVTIWSLKDGKVLRKFVPGREPETNKGE